MRDEIEQVIAKWREAPASALSELGHRAYRQRRECADELEAVLRRSRAVPSPGGAAEKDTPSMRFRKKPVVIEAQQFYADKCVKDEFYPCKPDVFAATYRLAESRAVIPEPPEADLTPEQLAELRADFVAWLDKRDVPPAVRKLLTPWVSPDTAEEKS